MAARLATADDRIMARAEGAYDRFDRRMVPRISSDKPQARGMRFDGGYLSPYFITDPERMLVAFEDACILICEGKISSRGDLLPLLERIGKTGKPLLIIAEDVGDDVLATLVVHKLSGPLQVAAVRAPGCGEQRLRLLREIALVTGAKSFGGGTEIQLNNLQISDLGQARKITVDKNHTVVESSNGYRHLSLQA